MKNLISFLFILICLSACNSPDVTNNDKPASHDHGTISILLFQDSLELFAEVDQLFAGHDIAIRAHLSFLENYSPAENGILYARVLQGGQSAEWEPLELAQPGIFTGTVRPEAPGLCDFGFLYEEGSLIVEFSQSSLKVYSHGDKLPEGPEHGDEAIFTKEQAWKTEFGLLELVPGDFQSSIHSSGEVVTPPGNLIEITAPANGRISYSGGRLIEGIRVTKGSELFTLLGSGLSDDNIIVELNTARAEYDRSQSNFERKEKLLRIQAVSQRDYDEAKADFQAARARYEMIKSQVGDSGISVESPVTGFIKEIRVSQNSYAETGSVLMTIIKDDGMLIKANVPVGESGKINLISSANIRLPGSPEVLSIIEMGGEVVSRGRSTEPSSGMVSMFLSVGSRGILPGTFVEIWLLGEIIENSLLIPASSLLEEYGKYFVYVQKEGEAYEKRAVKLGGFDGRNYMVTDGLNSGEVIVSKGAMAIKVANAMGAAPVHSH